MKKAARSDGFTLLEVFVVLAMLAVGFCVLVPALADTRSNSRAFKCLDNIRRLTIAWSMYSLDYSDSLLTCENVLTKRVNWCTGGLSFYANPSCWDINRDIVKSPLWPYTASNAAAFKCPSDPSAVWVDGVAKPRVRSYSMSQVFSRGDWLDKTMNPSQYVWRTYVTRGEIVNPAKTFLFIEEHPGSINDAAFANACTGAQPGDSPSAAQIIDFPASTHQGAGLISFTDGRVMVHKWLGSRIKPAVNSSYVTLNVPAEDSWADIQWLAGNTTVRR